MDEVDVRELLEKTSYPFLAAYDYFLLGTL